MSDEDRQRLRAEFEGMIDDMLDGGFTEQEIRDELTYLLEQR